MRRGSRRIDWTVSDERYLRESAGKVPRREICRHLKRSGEAVDQKAKRMGLSLRCYVPKTSICPKCGMQRSRFDRDGNCKVCRVRELIRRCEVETADAMARLNQRDRATYQSTESRLQSSPLPRPRPPDYRGMTEYQEARARDLHAMALEEWEERTLNRKLKAKRRRVERMLKKISQYQ